MSLAVLISGVPFKFPARVLAKEIYCMAWQCTAESTPFLGTRCFVCGGRGRVAGGRCSRVVAGEQLAGDRPM